MYEYEFIKHPEGTYFKTFLIHINHRLYHWHEDIEMLFLVEGSVWVDTGKTQYLLNRNDLLIINRNEIHSLTRTKETNTICAIQFNPRFCKSYYPKLQRIKFLDQYINQNTRPECWESLKNRLIAIVMDYYKKEDGYQLKLMSALNMMIYYLLQHLNYEYVAEDKFFAEEKNLERLNRIINYIQENYMNNISLKDLASQEDLDMYYLSHLIKKSLGISFQHYLNKVRLGKAVDLLTQTDRKNLDICIECGFSDYRYLSKMFIQEYGCTPSQYKLQCKDSEPLTFNADIQDQHIVSNQLEVLTKLL